MSITQAQLPWEVNWGMTHGSVVPKDMMRIIFNLLKPYQLLLASQVNAGWKKQIDEEWAIQLGFGDDHCLNTVRTLWDQYTKNKTDSYRAKELEKVEQISFRMKTVCGLTNNKFIETIALYRNLVSRFHEFNLEKATLIFHQQFGMKKRLS